MSSLSVNNSTDYLFNIQTVQSGAFRVLVEALKDPASSVRIAAAKALENIQRAKD